MVYAEFAIRKWTAQVPGPEPIHPFWPACWIDTPDRSSSSATGVVQDAWDVYGRKLEVVPHELVHGLRAAYDRSGVDDFWFAWSTGAEESLFRAYCRAGGPVAGNPQMYFGRGKLRVRIRRLGGRSAGGSCSSRLYRVSRGDEVDTHAAQYFVNSSVAPVLLFGRIESSC